MNFKNKKEKDDFIIKNMKLVDYVINRELGLFNTYDYTYDDVKQIGLMNLIKCVDTYDKSKGYEFSSYAVPYILGGIRREFRGKKRGIVYGRKIIRNKYKIESMLPYMTIEEIAKELDLSVDEVKEAKDISFGVASLDKSCGVDDNSGEEKSTFADVLMPPYEEDFDTNIYIEYLLSVISERERYVIEEIFYNNRSQTQIASQIGVSQMQVSRIMRKALKKMKECA